MKIEKIKGNDVSGEITSLANNSSPITSTVSSLLWETIKGKLVYWVGYDNDQMIAVLPGVEFGSGIFKRFQSMPDGLYSRILFSNNISDKDIVRNEMLKVLIKEKYAKIFISDYADIFEEASEYDKIKNEVYVVGISDTGWEPPDSKLQSEIRKAIREEVKVVTFDASYHFDRFLQLMQHTESRHNRNPRYPEKFYKFLSKLAAEDKRIIWKVVENDNALAASHIYFLENDTLLHWQAYFDKQYSFLKANQLIMYNVCKEVAEQGVKYLSMGANPDDAGTLDTYKQKWGGKKKIYHTLIHRSLFGKMF